MRDVGALEPVVFRPQTGYYTSLAEEAAGLMESLANNHPCLDGNKRVAFDASHTFLLMNGLTIEADPEETYSFMVGAIGEGGFRFPVILDWLKCADHADVRAAVSLEESAWRTLGFLLSNFFFTARLAEKKTIPSRAF